MENDEKDGHAECDFEVMLLHYKYILKLIKLLTTPCTKLKYVWNSE